MRLPMRPGVYRLVRLAIPFAAAGLLAGCFQPLYGEHSIGGPSIGAAMRSVDVSQIPASAGSPEARIAVETRNSLLFKLNGGASPPTLPAYRLNIQLTSTRLSVIVDLTSARPELENFGLNAIYTLVDAKTGKVVVNDQTFARVTYDVPGGAQRFARARGLRDAETRAAQVIAEAIRNRLASYFVAGT